MVGHWFESGLLLANVRLQDNEEDKWDKKQGLSVHIFTETRLYRSIPGHASEPTAAGRGELDSLKSRLWKQNIHQL